MDRHAASGLYEGSPECDLCEERPAVWTHTLDLRRATFRTYGREHVWASRVALCERCEGLYAAGDDEGVVAAHARTRERTDEDGHEAVRVPLAAFRRADTGAPVHRADLLPPGAAELIAQGYAPVGELTGSQIVAQVWPEAHRRTLPAAAHGGPDASGSEAYVLLRSPWPGLHISTVVDRMWPWVEAQAAPERDPAAWEAARIRVFLADPAGPPPPP